MLKISYTNYVDKLITFNTILTIIVKLYEYVKRKIHNWGQHKKIPKQARYFSRCAFKESRFGFSYDCQRLKLARRPTPLLIQLKKLLTHLGVSLDDFNEIKNMKKNLSKLNKVELRDVWGHEAIDFTNWLAQQENLDALSEEIGVDIKLLKLKRMSESLVLIFLQKKKRREERL